MNLKLIHIIFSRYGTNLLYANGGAELNYEGGGHFRGASRLTSYI